LKQETLSILAGASDMTLATVREDGYPQATTVSYVNDHLAIYFGYAAESQKAVNIARNDRVSLTVNLPIRAGRKFAVSRSPAGRTASPTRGRWTGREN
jgi:general stress protein 26